MSLRPGKRTRSFAIVALCAGTVVFQLWRSRSDRSSAGPATASLPVLNTPATTTGPPDHGDGPWARYALGKLAPRWRNARRRSYLTAEDGASRPPRDLFAPRVREAGSTTAEDSPAPVEPFAGGPPLGDPASAVRLPALRATWTRAGGGRAVLGAHVVRVGETLPGFEEGEVVLSAVRRSEVEVEVHGGRRVLKITESTRERPAESAVPVETPPVEDGS